MTKSFVVVLITLAVSATASPQSTPPHKPSTLINGKTNPNLIPDNIAYRLIFLSLSVPSANPTASDVRRQEAHLRVLDFSSSERESLKALLKEFRSQYDRIQLMQKSGTAKSGRTLKEQLVTDIKTRLTQKVTAAHIQSFNAFVQSRKAYMTTTEVQQ